MNSAVDNFLAACDAQIGLPFLHPSEENEFSGSGLIGCRYPEGRSSAGFVSVSLLAAGDVIDRRKMWNVHRYWMECQRVLCPQPGDFAIYGKDGHATRMMVVCRQAGVDLLVGAINDDEGIVTPGMAEANEARVAIVHAADFTTDLMGYVANPLRLEPKTIGRILHIPPRRPTDFEAMMMMLLALALQPFSFFLVMQKSFLAPLLPVPLLIAFAAGVAKPRRFSSFAWMKRMIARKGK